MSITSKGKAWEARNSFWIIGAFIPMFYWIPFFWIGTRARQKKWVLFGFMYLITGFVFPIIAGEKSIIKNEIMENIFIYGYMIFWVISIVHSFFARKEYLIRREIVLTTQETTNSVYRQKILNQYGQQGNSQQGIPNSVPLQTNNKISQTQESGTKPLTQKSIPTQKIDLNIATEQVLANLPGVGVALAKRAVEIRTQIDGFASIQDFNQRLGLMPHFAVQIENLAFIEPPQAKTPSAENSERIIDI